MMNKLGCVGLVLLCVILIAAVVAVEAVIIRLFWNYVLVDSLNVAVAKMTFKAAVITALCLSVIGSMFRSTSTSK